MPRSLLIFLIPFLNPSLAHCLQDKVIHGQDNRVEVFKMDGSFWQDKIRAVAMQIDNDKLIFIKEDEEVLIKGESLKENQKLCQEERFSSQLAVGHCTAFLVADDIMATAGHCVRSQFDCQHFSWVFDYQLKDESDSDYSKIKKENIYRCQKILKTLYSPATSLDYALIKLDRKVVDRDPLELRSEGKVATGTAIAVIGHPDGIPMKMAAGARVIGNDNEIYFSANLDTFHVNSGSPIFDLETGVVEGILVRGEGDYIYDQENKCRRVNVIQDECQSGNCMLEEVTRITQVKL